MNATISIAEKEEDKEPFLPLESINFDELNQEENFSSNTISDSQEFNITMADTL
jgi:hypothetical protein